MKKKIDLLVGMNTWVVTIEDDSCTVDVWASNDTGVIDKKSYGSVQELINELYDLGFGREAELKLSRFA